MINSNESEIVENTILKSNIEKLVKFYQEPNIKILKINENEMIYKTTHNIVVHKIDNILSPIKSDDIYNKLLKLESEVIIK